MLERLALPKGVSRGYRIKSWWKELPSPVVTVGSWVVSSEIHSPIEISVPQSSHLQNGDKNPALNISLGYEAQNRNNLSKVLLKVKCCTNLRNSID